jgi:hypothetical protein
MKAVFLFFTRGLFGKAVVGVIGTAIAAYFGNVIAPAWFKGVPEATTFQSSISGNGPAINAAAGAQVHIAPAQTDSAGLGVESGGKAPPPAKGDGALVQNAISSNGAAVNAGPASSVRIESPR